MSAGDRVDPLASRRAAIERRAQERARLHAPVIKDGLPAYQDDDPLCEPWPYVEAWAEIIMEKMAGAVDAVFEVGKALIACQDDLKTQSLWQSAVRAFTHRLQRRSGMVPGVRAESWLFAHSAGTGPAPQLQSQRCRPL